MDAQALIKLLAEHVEDEDMQGQSPIFLMSQEDDTLEAVSDILERARMHVEDVLSYHEDMREYRDVAE